MKRWIAAFLCIFLLLAAAGCSSMLNRNDYAVPQSPQVEPSKSDAGYSPGGNTSAAEAEMGWGEETAASDAVGGAAPAPAPSLSGGYGGHKIIKNASLGLETREFDAHIAYIKAKTEDMGGYVSSSYVSGKKPENYNDPGRYSNITVRLPQERMEAFLADARGLATVTHENAGSDDITATYLDTESRVKIYTEQRERILALLAKADTMEDIISLESELSRLTYEIEALTTDLRRWDDLIEFATVSIDVTEIPPASAISSPDSMGVRISEGFSNTLSGIAVFFEELVIVLLAISPVLVILAIITLVIVLLVRRGSKKRRAKMHQAQAQMYYQPVPMQSMPPQPDQAAFVQPEVQQDEHKDPSN